MAKQFCPRAEHLKVKKPVYVIEIGIHLHSTAIKYILAHVCISLWIKSGEIKRKAARRVWPRWRHKHISRPVHRLMQVFTASFFSLVTPFRLSVLTTQFCFGQLFAAGNIIELLSPFDPAGLRHLKFKSSVIIILDDYVFFQVKTISLRDHKHY